MKVIEKALLLSYFALLIGIVNRIFTINQSLNNFLVVSFFTFIILPPAYVILSLVKKKNRIDSLLLLISTPMILGIHFMLLFWEGGKHLVITGTSAILLGSIIILVYSLIKKIDVVRGLLYVGLGFGAMYFCFHVLLWDFSYVFIIPTFIATFIALFLIIKEKRKIETQYWVSLSILTLLFISFLSQESII